MNPTRHPGLGQGGPASVYLCTSEPLYVSLPPFHTRKHPLFSLFYPPLSITSIHNYYYMYIIEMIRKFGEKILYDRIPFFHTEPPIMYTDRQLCIPPKKPPEGGSFWG
jgi:hypothetical protein